MSAYFVDQEACMREIAREQDGNSLTSLTSLIKSPSSITLDELLTAAMRACDHHGDSDTAREDMRADCLATPLHQRLDLLDYFVTEYGHA
ncbi:MAG: hypothetical protein ACRYGA_00585 [Janthinobacterium lividum]